MAEFDNLKTELLAAKASIEPQIEGLHDFARLNIKPETMTVVNAAIVDFERRLGLIVAALAALDALENDKYPTLERLSVNDDVFEDLKDNVDTIEAAFKQFENEAFAVTITAGTPTEQP